MEVAQESTRPAATHARRTLTNALATVFGRGLGQLARFFALLIMLAHLSGEVWGLFSLLLSALDIARVLTNFGIDTAATRDMATRRHSEGLVLRKVLRLKTGFALVGMLGLALYVSRLTGLSSVTPLLILPLALWPMAWSASLTARFQATHAMHWLIPVQAVVGGIYLLAVYFAGRAGVQLTGFVVLTVAFEAVTYVATALVGRRVWSTDRTAPVRDATFDVRAFLWQALPLGLLDVVVIVYMRLGIFLVQSRSAGGEVAAGHLYAAIKTNEYTVAFGAALAASALPAFAQLVHAGQPQRITRTFLRYSTIGAAFAVSAALFFTLFGRTLLMHVKPAHVDAAEPLSVLTWAGVAMFQNNLSTAVINAFGRFRVAALCAVFNLAVFASVGFWLIPRHGAMGAAYATLLTEGLNMLVQLSYVTHLLRTAVPLADVAPLPQTA
jgi:O-antigen/teichoic acid export membrane protein